MDALLRSQAHIHSIPNDDIKTNSRITQPDGGVDAQVDSFSKDDKTGYFLTKTIWQYKDTAHTSISLDSLKKEIRKPYAAECIKKGYGYRLAINDELTPKKKNEWSEGLTSQARNLNSNAVEVKILTSSDLAVWASEIYTLIAQYTNKNIGLYLYFNAWKSNIIADCEFYQTVPENEKFKNIILEHINYSKTPNSVVLTFQGETGIGKTRLIYEFLKDKNAENIVIYNDNEQTVLHIANELANQLRKKAILIADQCTNKEISNRLDDLLRGHKERIRVISIITEDEEADNINSGYKLQKMNTSLLEGILVKNFPYLPRNRINLYARESCGFIKLAVNMCKNDSEASPQGGLIEGLKGAQLYLTRSLDDNQKRIIGALGLFGEIGYKEDVSNELEDFCSFLKIDNQTFHETANILYKKGLLDRIGRYYRITNTRPIASLCFQNGWNRFADHNAEEFLGEIPSSLLVNFLQRAAKSNDSSIKKSISNHFRNWACSVALMNLNEIKTAEIFLSLVEIDCDQYLPILNSIFLKALPEDLLGLDESIKSKIFKAYVELAAYDKNFKKIESTLLKLALYEKESIFSNKREIWKSLFAFYGSNTPVPYLERLAVLKEYISSNDSEISHLALEALKFSFQYCSPYFISSAFVGGQVPPLKWSPRNNEEWLESISAYLELLGGLLTRQNDSLITCATQILIDRLHIFIKAGFLERVQSLLALNKRHFEFRSHLLKKLKEFVKVASIVSKEGGEDSNVN